MITVQQLTAAVRKTIGTPFHHGGRIVGPLGGMDCGGIMIWALRDLGYEVKDNRTYSRGDHLSGMVFILRENNFTQKKQSETPKAGDLILIRSGSMFHHLLYLTEDGTVIHAWRAADINRVVENNMLPEWNNMIHSIWRFSNLEN